MDQQPSTPQDNSHQQTGPAAQESIFTDLVDDSQYDRNLRNARIWLYVVAGIQLLVGCYEYYSLRETDFGWIAFAIDAFIGAVFFAMALWSKKKPVTAFLSALIFYIVVILLIAIADPLSIFKGIIIKIFFIIALIKAYRDAKESEDLRKAAGLNNY